MLIKDILSKLTALCRKGSMEHRLQNQQLLRNLDAHSEVLCLLRIPCDLADETVFSVMCAAHEFLQAFVHNNSPNQIVLQAHLGFFLDQLSTNLPAPETLIEIYRNNLDLCRSVLKSTIQRFISCIESRGRHVVYLR